MSVYEPKQGRLGKHDLLQLATAINDVKQSMYSLLEIVEGKDWGMSDEFCDKYPFEGSFDEVCFSVGLWSNAMKQKHADEVQAEQDFYLGSSVFG